ILRPVGRATIYFQRHGSTSVQRASRAGIRRVRRLVPGAGPARKQFGIGALRFARRGWLLRSGWQRRVADGPGLRRDLGAERRCGWLSALSLWPLDLDRPVGLDVGGRRALGLRAISLRALGVCARR